jgi:hypothetical protein
MLTPRIVLFAIWLFSDYLGLAFETRLWPFLGFLFMPLTTLAYAWAVNTYGSVKGIGLVVVVLAVLFDLGLLGGGGAAGRRRFRREQA